MGKTKNLVKVSRTSIDDEVPYTQVPPLKIGNLGNNERVRA